MANYYKPLAPGEFRVLELLPGHPMDRLRSRLEVVTAGDRPYEAVSYCWGSDLKQETILVDRDETVITCSLAAALRRLRYISQSRYLWIDRICINQDNNSEKSVQVGEMMGRIYAETTGLVIWLGEGDIDSRRAINIINQLAQNVKERPTDSDAPYADLSQGNLRDSRGLVNLDPWMVLCRFLERPWFQRTWVVQELCLPKTNNIDAYCGADVVPWWKVSLAQSSLLRYHWFRHLHEAPLQYKVFLSALRRIGPSMQMRRAMFKASQNQQPADSRHGATLLENLRILNGFGVTDERDRIFALKYISIRPGPTDLSVDYSLPLAAVATETTRKIIEHQDDLMVLGMCQLTGKRQDFPSWVPDWTIRPEYRPQRILSLGVLAPGNTAYSALPQVSPILLDSPRSNNLWLKGYRISTVDRVSMDRDKATLQLSSDQIYLGTDQGEFPSQKILRDIISVAGRDNSRIGGPLPSGASLDSSWPLSEPKRILYDKLISEMNVSGKQFESNITKPLDRARKQLDALIAQAWELSGKERSNPMTTYDALISAALLLLPPELSQYPEDASLWDTLIVERDQRGRPVTSSNPSHDIDSYMNAFRQTLLGHKFFVTEDDDFGIGVYEVRAGDVVVLFPGAVVPFILRRSTGNDWELVGECYCHSYMDGKRGKKVMETRDPELFSIV